MAGNDSDVKTKHAKHQRDKDSNSSDGRRGRGRKIILIIVAIILFGLAGRVGFFLAQHFDPFGVGGAKLQQIKNDQLGLEDKPVTDADRSNYQVPATHPRYLTIASIGVNNARVQSVATDKANQMGVPTNIYDVGWYSSNYPSGFGQCSGQQKLPGDSQTDCAAVIDGHSCTGRLICVFDNLDKVKNGDQIVVELGNGKKLNYDVKKVDIVPLDQVDMAKVMQPINNGQDGLNLITCTGNWTAKDAAGVPTMNQRVIVYAILE